LTERLRAGGLSRTETIAMGVESGCFSPSFRSAQLRATALASLGLDEDATLLVGVGRFSGEKRWEMVLRAVEECSRDRPVGLLLVGDGPRRQRIEMMAARMGHVAVIPRLDDRHEVARLLASADALVHGCEAETFCLVAAEARASGIPMIIPDRGAALDQLAPHAGITYRAGSERSLQQAIGEFVERGQEMQRAAAARLSKVRTMDEHFADLFASYQSLAPAVARPAFATDRHSDDAAGIPQLALARSGVRRS
jgi:alpha-1,6-mannosyltransferase